MSKTPPHGPRRRGRISRFAIAVVAQPAMAAWAAPAAPLPVQMAQAEPAPAQRVEIRADPGAQRRADLAGRQVVSREELLRHGDARLSDALQRVPGVSVQGRGSAVELKLGGLGGGYTQVLINGEPVPRDFSLDSIALDSLERVEIVRGATVQSSQAIAGSINLVTRQAAPRGTREIKLNLASQWGRPQGTATLNLGDRAGQAQWGLGFVASSERRLWPATLLQERREGVEGTLTQRTLTHKHEYDQTDALALNPRLAWKADSAGGSQWQLSTDHSLRYAVSRGGVHDERTPLLGPAPLQQVSDLFLNYRRLFWRGQLQAQHRTADKAQTELRLNITHSRRNQDARGTGFDFMPRQVQDSSVTGLAIDESVILRLAHQRPLGTAYRLDLGAEWEQGRRREDRIQVEKALPGGLPPENLDERYDARVSRRAAYGQVDWTVSARMEAQMGLRVEQLETDSQGNVFDGVRQSHRLVGPVARVSVTPEGLGTFKLGLSRGFKLPAPRDVMPRRYVPVEVTPTSPAMTGNPDLRPERAWSLDGSWQRSLPAWKGELVVSAAWRRIDDVILDRLLTQTGVSSAPWLLQRFNGGRAQVASLEVELRGQAPGLGQLLLPGTGTGPARPGGNAQPARWQASLALNRSRLLDVPGARPALPGQAPWQLKLDLTQAFSAGAGPMTAQLGLVARGRAAADLPSERRLAFPARHGLTASLSWQPRPRQGWRISVAQWAANDEVDEKSVRTSQGGVPVVYTSRDAWHRQAEWRLGFESGF